MYEDIYGGYIIYIRVETTRSPCRAANNNNNNKIYSDITMNTEIQIYIYIIYTKMYPDTTIETDFQIYIYKYIYVDISRYNDGYKCLDIYDIQ